MVASPHIKIRNDQEKTQINPLSHHSSPTRSSLDTHPQVAALFAFGAKSAEAIGIPSSLQGFKRHQ